MSAKPKYICKGERGREGESGKMKRRIGSSLFAFSCGCKDSKSVSVSVSDSSEKSTAILRRRREPSPAEALILASSSSSCNWEEGAEKAADDSLSTPSFSGLLSQLSDLERSVMAWGPAESEKEGRRRRHRRCRSEGSGRVGESVAVVTETEDPLGDFRRSMLQMIVEKEIVGGEELRELLRRFLALNSPHHHDLILRAFADIWADVFSGHERTPELLRHSSTRFHHPRRRL